MSRAQEVRKRISKKVKEDSEEHLRKLGQIYYDYVVDVIDAVGCNADCRDSITVKLSKDVNEGSCKRSIKVETVPNTGKDCLKKENGEEVNVSLPKLECNVLAFTEMKNRFKGEQGFYVFINGSEATVTMTID